MNIRVGGAGANAALAFVGDGPAGAADGVRGRGSLGEWMRQELTEAGLADELAVLSGRPTGLTVALESDERDRTFLTHLGVNADWVPEMIPADALACDNLLLCDYCVTPGLQGSAARALLGATRARRGADVLRHRVGSRGLPAGDARGGARPAARRRRVPAQRGRGARDRRRG